MVAAAAFAAEPDEDRFAFANALAQRRMWAEAAAEYESLTNSPVVARDEAAFRLADSLRRAGRAAEAKDCYETVFRQWPASRWSDLARLDAFTLETNRTVRLTNLKSLLRPDTAHDIRQLALYRIGQMYEEDKAAGAMEAFEKSYREDPSSRTGALAAIKYAALAAALDEPPKNAIAAALHVAATFKEAPLREEALYLAAVIAYRANEQDKAAKLFNELHRDFPASRRDADARHLRALTLLSTGKFEAAYEAAGELGGESETGLYIRLTALSQMSRPVDCRKLCREYLSRYPDGRWVANTALILVAGCAAEKSHAEVLATVSSRGDWPEAVRPAMLAYACDAALALKDWTKTAAFAARLRQSAADSSDGRLAARASYLEGLARHRMGDAAAAKLCWTDALQSDPAGEWAEKALSARAAQELKDGEALSAARSYEELSRRFPAAAQTPENLYRRGLALSAAGDAPGAESVFGTLAAMGEEGAEALDLVREAKLRLAVIYQDSDRFAPASEMISGLLGTSTEEIIPPGLLVEQARADLEDGRNAAALAIAKAALARAEAAGAEATMVQAAACVLGEAHLAVGERDAARALWRRAIETPAKTVFAIKSRLDLGVLESENGNFEEAAETLLEAVARSGDESLAQLRMECYMALADNERRRGDAEGELRYRMIVLTLFNDSQRVPEAIDRAVEILRSLGRPEEAASLEAEKEARYGR